MTVIRRHLLTLLFLFLVSEWVSLISFGGVSGLIGYSVYTTARLHYSSYKGNQVNESVKKDVAKVVDTIDVEDIGKKAVFCRCWRSKKVSANFFESMNRICDEK